MSLPPLVSPADDLTVDEVRRYSRHLIIPDVGKTGQRRLKKAQLAHVKVVLGDMHAAPVAAESADFVLSQQSLQYAADPPKIFREAARILKPGGRLLVVTLAAHEHDEVRGEYGHVHLGFRAQQLRAWARAASLSVTQLASAGRERRPPQFEALALLAHKPRKLK